MTSVKKSRRKITTAKQIAFPAVLLMLFAASQPVVTLLNTSLTQPSMAVAYTGVDNIMTIKGDLNGGELRIERSGGPVSMRPGTNIVFKLRYDAPGRDTIRLYSDNRLLVERIYEIQPAAYYSVGLAGTEDTLLSAESVKKAGRLTVKMPGTYFRPAEKVTGFSVDICTSERKILRKFTITGASFSPELLQDVSERPPGTMLIFHTINTNLATGKYPKKNEFTVLLK